MNESKHSRRSLFPVRLIPFWILDFGFWIVKELLSKLLTIPSVAIIIQIAIRSYRVWAGQK